jgi:hypothetical protein
VGLKSRKWSSFAAGEEWEIWSIQLAGTLQGSLEYQEKIFRLYFAARERHSIE